MWKYKNNNENWLCACSKMFYLHHFHIKLLPFMRLFQLFVKLAVCLFVWSSSICAKNNILPKISKLEQLHGVYEIGINVVSILERLFQKQGVSTSKMWVSQVIMHFCPSFYVGCCALVLYWYTRCQLFMPFINILGFYWMNMNGKEGEGNLNP